jgi:hypothetical protein
MRLQDGHRARLRIGAHGSRVVSAYKRLTARMTADAKVAADFKAVWDQFKTTREKEIISAIYKGSADHAKKIADGIQSERLHCSEMLPLMSESGHSEP